MYKDNIDHHDKPKEECGVFGIEVMDDDLNGASITQMALYSLQHRGQEGCGIAVSNNSKIFCHKDIGLVSEVFDEFSLNLLKGKIFLGHTRYSTTGVNSASNTQPLVVKHSNGDIGLAHNGNLINALELKHKLAKEHAKFKTSIDSEVIAILLSQEKILGETLENALLKIMNQIKGSYSIVLTTDNKLIGVRDPIGFRPLSIGKIGNSYMLSSETCTFDSLGAEFVRDVLPGEIVIIENGELYSNTTLCGHKENICIFEYIYFARSDSMLSGIEVYEARKTAGKCLAKETPVDADVVIGVPDSGIAAAVGYSEYSKIPYGHGLLKNRYIGRTFIQPTQTERERGVHIKLNVLKSEVEGKRVILVDDSIVRGTTCKKIVKLLRDAGAKEVHLRISAPPFKYSCYFGTDIYGSKELIAFNNSVESIREKIGVETLGYLSMEALQELTPGREFCDGCFSGKYPIEVPNNITKGILETI